MTLAMVKSKMDEALTCENELALVFIFVNCVIRRGETSSSIVVYVTVILTSALAARLKHKSRTIADVATNSSYTSPAIGLKRDPAPAYNGLALPAKPARVGGQGGPGAERS